ncbi:diphthamide biosynthesis protein 3 [Peziza echinospora]|nr:diphthamide biosynthesis protein 3 [Peziza echinospora]
MSDDTPTIYDQIEIEDMTFDPALSLYHYPCPCGDRFEISIYDLEDGEDVAVCPSCSLMIKVIFEPEDIVGDMAKLNNTGVGVAAKSAVAV